VFSGWKEVGSTAPPRQREFLHRKVTESGIVCSMCIRCDCMVGYSANPRILAIAEQAHRCRQMQAKGKTTTPVAA
jgi:hypothetical protein